MPFLRIQEKYYESPSLLQSWSLNDYDALLVRNYFNLSYCCELYFLGYG